MSNPFHTDNTYYQEYETLDVEARKSGCYLQSPKGVRKYFYLTKTRLNRIRLGKEWDYARTNFAAALRILLAEGAAS